MEWLTSQRKYTVTITDEYAQLSVAFVSKQVMIKTFFYFFEMFLVFTLISGSMEFTNNTHGNKLKREIIPGPKRYLMFPQGSNVQLVYCMTIGSYAKPKTFFTVGVTAGLAYELPHRNSVLYRKPAEVYHRRSRRELYRKLELMLNTRGKDGRACVMKALCHAGARNVSEVGKGTFIQEILHSVFTLPSGSYHEDPKTPYEMAHETTENCDVMYPTCRDVF